MERVLNWSVIISISASSETAVQMLKKLTRVDLLANVLTVVVSVAFTLVAAFSYYQINAIATVWYSSRCGHNGLYDFTCSHAQLSHASHLYQLRGIINNHTVQFLLSKSM